MKHFWKLWALDTRALSLFRILLGLMVLGDLWQKSESLKAFYTDQGTLPRSEQIAKFLHPDFWSFHFISGQEGIVSLIFLIHGLLAILFILGWQTKAVNILLFLFTISMQNRNLIILNGGDDFLRIFIFWSIFLPLNVHWSLDNADKEFKPYKVSSLVTMGVVLQFFWIYFSSAVLKSSPTWHQEGTATFFALSLDQFTTPIGKVLLNFPNFLKLNTWLTMIIEGIVPFLLFIPFRIFNFRKIVVLAFFALHTGIALTMHIGMFPFICLTVWTMMLWWDKEEDIEVSKNPMPLFLIFIISWWNLATMGWVPAVNDKVRSGMYTLRLDQSWGMFAPTPLREDGWYVIIGQDINKKEISLFSKGEVSFEKPTYVAKTYKSEPWRKYMMNIYLENNAQHRPLLSEYYCKEYNFNVNSEEVLVNVKIYFMKEISMLDKTQETIEKVLLYEHNCQDTNPDGNIFELLEGS